MNKAAEELGSDTVGKAKNLQNLVQKKKGDPTSYFIVLPMILQEFVQPDWHRLAGGFNFSFKCGVWMECYMMSRHMCEDMGGFSR